MDREGEGGRIEAVKLAVHLKKYVVQYVCRKIDFFFKGKGERRRGSCLNECFLHGYFPVFVPPLKLEGSPERDENVRA